MRPKSSQSSIHDRPGAPHRRIFLRHPVFRRFIAAVVLFPLALALGACTSTSSSIGGSSAAFSGRVTTPPLASDRYAAIVVDASSGRMIYGHDQSAQRFPASLTKMMTLYMLFEQMQAGRINTSTVIPVSRSAAAKPPTKIGFKPGEGIDVDSAIKALITRSANDVASAIGEYLGNGSEDRFAQMMTQKARSLGMRDTRFRNASGLPDPLQVTTAKDMATLSIALRRQFPQYYRYFSVTQFSYRGKLIRGHNKLVEDVPGVDGLKTGYIRASGYNVATSVSRSGRRLVVVVLGADSGRERNAHAAQLIEEILPSPGGSSSLPGVLSVLDPGTLPGVVAE